MDTPKKTCIRCGLEKDEADFYIRKETQKPRGECKKCWSRRNNERFRDYHINYWSEYRKNNSQKYLKAMGDYRRNNPEKIILKQAKSRAKEKMLEFNLDVSDIIIPEYCPVLNLKLKRNTGKGPKADSPSLDRIDNKLGYIKGNVRVISFRANSLKKDATIDELKAIIADMENIKALTK